MSERLLSVGLDVGTTTTQLIVSGITVENRASAFAVPSMEITSREILYESPVRFTPLLDDAYVDGAAIRDWVAEQYEKAGIRKEDVDTGAIIITGETSRKENARVVLENLSSFAGDFVVATAGPDLESVLAAKGAGAVDWSEQTGHRVLHVDIGGGTSNMALIEDGHITATGCMNVGGRLLKFSEGRIIYISPVLQGLTSLQVGDAPTREQLREVAGMLVEALEMAAGLREKTELLDALSTREVTGAWECPPGAVLSFSGGVADCIEKTWETYAFGDLGPLLGQAIRESRLCQGRYRLGEQTIRATVIGAGCHSAQLSGSTVFYQNVALPLQNLPVAAFSRQPKAEEIRQRLQQEDGDTVVIALPGYAAPTYDQVRQLGDTLLQVTDRPMVAMEGDMAKALGHYLCMRLPADAPCMCIDRVRLQEGSYLDVGQPVGPALPVVIKTLILSK